MFNFNGKSAKDFPWLRVKSITGSILPPLQRRYITVPSKPGAYHAGRDVGIRQERITIKVNGGTMEQLMERRRALAEWLDTEQSAPFFYDHEPHRIYRAVLSRETNLDQILYYGEAELIFEMPDPYATSAEVKSTLLQGHIVREIFGDWSRGTLTDVVADGSDLRLAREGEDVAGTIDGNWETGTHNNTAPISSDPEQRDFERSWAMNWSEDATLSGVRENDDGHLVQELPNFAIRDDMSNIQNTGWQRYGSGNESFIFQEDGYVLFDLEDSVPSNQVGIARYFNIPFEEATIVFTARTTNTGLPLWVRSGSKGYLFSIPNTSGELLPFLIRISGEGVEYYGAGVPLNDWYSIVEDSGDPIFQFYVDPNDSGRFEVEQFLFTDTALDLPENNPYWSGVWESDYLDLSSVVLSSGAQVSFENFFPLPGLLSYTEVDYKLRIQGVEQGWENLFNGTATGQHTLNIPDFPNQMDGVEIKLRVRLHTADPGRSPTLKNFSLRVSSSYIQGDFLQLAKTGEDFIRNWEDQEAWENPENNRLNTGSDPNGNLRLIGLPEWEFVDLMTDYTQNWRVQSPTAGGTVTQHDGYVTIKGQGVTSNFGIDTQQNNNVVTVFPCTIFFKFRGRDTTNARFIIEDGSSIGYTHQFDDEANEWAYYWIRCGLNGATVYRNGLEIAQLPVRSGGGVANQIQFDIQNEGRGDFDIGPIYIDWWYDKGPPPETGWWDGLFETPTFELSQVGTAQGATLNWAYGFTGSNPDDFQIDIEYQIDGGSWQPISDNGNTPFMEGGAPIPEIAKGDDLTGKTIKLRAILKSRDPLYWPYLERLRLSIPSAYHTSGYWDSEPVDLSPVGRARQSFISWVADSVPAGTSVKIYTRFDFGEGWTSWEEVSESGSMVPGIDPDTDLTTAQFQCRVELLTDDIALTPSVDRLDFGFRAAYVPSGEWVSPPIPLEGANEVGDSIISWDWNEIEDLTVEIRLNGGEWQPATNGGEIPGARGTEGATLEVRLKLSTSDASASPIISRLEVLVREAAQTEITYEGSAPGLPRFHVEVTEAVEELRITHLETGKFILLQGSFQPGDEIEIDHEDESIRLNGIHRLTFLNINSRFFKLAKGVNRFEVSPKFGPVVTMEWAERWK